MIRTVCIFLGIVLACGCHQQQNLGDNSDQGAISDLAGGPALDGGSGDLATLPDPCQGVACNAPPASYCVDSKTLRSYLASGVCTNGQCGYMSTDMTCAYGCQGGMCKPDPCTGVVCNLPPPATCIDATTTRHYYPSGTCAGGTCSYRSYDNACNVPPLSECVNSSTLRSYSSSGTCLFGSCSYSSSVSSCMYGCVAGACNATPKRLFVTRGTFDANFGPHPTGDTLCQIAANAAAIGGTWKAWLADPGLGYAPAIADVGPWYAMDGTTKLFNNAAGLGGFPLAPITLDEYGATVGSGATVWTGLTVGLRSASTCYTWNCFDGCSPSNTVYKGTYGQTGTTMQEWTDAGPGECYVKRHLYCLEQ